MRLTLVLSSLAAGGAERVLVTLANHWVGEGKQVTLLTFDDGSTPPFYPLDGRVLHRPLALARQSPNVWAAARNNLSRIRGLREALRKSRPEVVISFMAQTNVRTLLAAYDLGCPVIISERVNPAYSTSGWFWHQLRRVTYRRASAIVAQTKRGAAGLPLSLQAKVRVIPNPVALSRQLDQAADRPVRKGVIAVGRLDRQKGFDLLLQAFAQLRDRYPSWTLTILGEGRDRRQLESLRARLGLDAWVSLPGEVREVAEALGQAELFVLPSRYEGFPNALCEAMACGLPVIAADCPYGPREIVCHETDGLLVPPENIEALVAAMSRLMQSEPERKRLGSLAVKVGERFSLVKVAAAWERLLGEVIAVKNKP